MVSISSGGTCEIGIGFEEELVEYAELRFRFWIVAGFAGKYSLTSRDIEGLEVGISTCQCGSKSIVLYPWKGRAFL